MALKYVGPNVGATVETAELEDDAVTGAKIADDAIDSAHYADGSIDTAHIADNQITTAKIADDNVTLAKIAGGTANKYIGFDASGDPAEITGADVSPLEKQQLEQAVAIIALEANASTTHQDYTTMFVDKYSDYDGYDGTIDSSNTTAVLDDTTYKNMPELDQFSRADAAVVGNGWTETETGGTCAIASGKLEIARTDNTTDAEKNFGAQNPTRVDIRCKIDDATTNNGLIIYFYKADDTIEIRFKINADVLYYDDGAYQTTTYVPLDNTYFTLSLRNINYVAYTYDIYVNDALEITGAAFRNNDVIDKICIEAGANARTVTVDYVTEGSPANKLVQTNAITVTTAQTHHQVYCNNATAGSGAVTYDISFDNGTNWDTGQALDTKNTRSAATGTQMILKLNLSGSGDGNTASADDYAVMLWW